MNFLQILCFIIPNLIDKFNFIIIFIYKCIKSFLNKKLEAFFVRVEPIFISFRVQENKKMS